MADQQEGQSYPLQFRTPRSSWWLPLLGAVAVMGWVKFGALIVAAPLLALGVALDHQGSYETAFNSAATLKPLVWPALLGVNLGIATLIAVASGLFRVSFGQSARWMLSVVGRFRWRFFLVCLGLSLIAILAQIGIGSFLPTDPNDLGDPVNDATWRLVSLGIVVVLTTPIQAVGEEFAFRGYLMSGVGAITRKPWVAVAVSGLLFAIAHGSTDVPLFLDRLAFGLVAGYLVVRTGGLEASIAFHILNNVFAFGLALVIGNIDDALSVDSEPWSQLALTVGMEALYLGLVLWACRRMRITSRTGVPVLAPTTPHV